MNFTKGVYIIINSCWKLNHIIHLYCPSLLAGLLGCIECPHRADVCKSMLNGQHWHSHMKESLREHCSSVFSSALHVLIVLLGWFVRWEVNVLWGVASRVYSKLHMAFICSSYLAFSPSVSFFMAVPSTIPKISGSEKGWVTHDVRQQNIVRTSWVNFSYEHPNYFLKVVNFANLSETKSLPQDKISLKVPFQSIMKYLIITYIL